MKVKNLFFCTLFLCCVLGIQSLNAQLVEKATITANEANFKLINPSSYLMEIAGPNDYYFRQEIAFTNNISLSNVDVEGKKFPDGTYKMQVTPIVTLSETTRQELAALRKENDQEKIAAFRLEHELPAEVNVYNIAFSIHNGQFVSPDQKEAKGLNLSGMTGMIWEQDLLWEQNHPVLYASLNTIDLEYSKPSFASNALPLARDNTPMVEDDQVILDDLIVSGGSLCVGLDCVNGESFGFDTGRFKENNLRIHFFDTSNTASFPGNDWRIRVNDSDNGGANYFAVEDATNNRTPFLVEAGAPNNSLYVDDGGKVGVGTSTPVVEIHNKNGDSPTLRLEQDGSSGFTPQTWDVAGNEANFFIRDATNGSKLPFKIKPGAPTGSLFIAADGDIGFGTESPDAHFHVRRNDGNTSIIVEEASSTASFRTMATLTNGPGGGMAFRLTNGTHSIDYNNTGMVGSEEFRINHVDGDPQEFSLDQAGNLTITGNLTTATQTIPDYVFADDYKLLPLDELKAFITEEKHLPNIPSESEFAAQGNRVDMSRFQMLLLEKIEELTLYTLQQQQTIEEQVEEIADLKSQLTKMEILETKLAELSQTVSALNKNQDTSDSSNKTIEEKE